MTIEEGYRVYRILRDEADYNDRPLQTYFNLKLSNQRIEIMNNLIKSEVDIDKFFLANVALRQIFFIDGLKTQYEMEKAMNYYHLWDKLLERSREPFFKKIDEAAKKVGKFDYENVDRFLDLIQQVDYKFFSTIYPECKELLGAVNQEWIDFFKPEWGNPMSYISKVIRANMVLRNIKGFSDLKKLVHKRIFPKSVV